jgi:exopolyphosphatase / guanosine-5'-triphosphate,3'-diphosphate pyrophosphatase
MTSETGSPAPERRQAVIDLGSNSFRLVVFTWVQGAWWKRTDEIHEGVRIGEGLEQTGALNPEPMERALRTLELYAHFCASMGITDIRPVATSAIRDASNQADFLRLARERTGLEVEVLPKEEEARYGYLAAVNTTTLETGVSLDLGGGSMQLTNVARRVAVDARSWPFGAVRMTERFLPDKKASKKQIKALRTHVREALERDSPWLLGAGSRGGMLAGIGGTVRNLAAASELAEDLPSYGVQGFAIRRDVLDGLVDRFADSTASERRRIPGIKPERADLILAGSLVIQSIMELGEFTALEATEAGLREGVFFSTLLAGTDPPLFADVRHEAVRNLARSYEADLVHADHVAALALQMFDELAARGVHAGNSDERGLLWAAAILHDIGMTVDYDDHHKHSRYLILNAALPGYSTRERALIGQMARYHRKGSPSLGMFAPIARPGDDELLDRCAAVLRIAEQLERSRDQSVHAATMDVMDGTVHLRLDSGDVDVPLARWAAEREADLFERAFGKTLAVGR